MSDGETSSDTLRERLGKLNRARAPSSSYAMLAAEAIEYAAQLEAKRGDLQHRLDRLDRGTWEARMDSLYEWAAENIDGYSRLSARAPEGVLIEALDEARAERDRLHDALNWVWHALGAATSWDDVEDAEGHAQKALREVERGDTVNRIWREARREAFEEAAQVVDPPPGGQGGTNLEAQKLAAEIRALAEGDDQEDDES